MKNVLFLFNGKRIQLYQEFSGGNAPDDFLYAYNHMSSFGVDSGFIEPQYGKNPVVRDLWKYSIGLIFDWLEIKFSFTQYLQVLKESKNAKVIISTVDTLGLPLLFCKWLKIISPGVVFISQGLTNPFEGGKLAFWKLACHRIFYRVLLGEAEDIVVLGDGAKSALTKTLNLPDERVKVLQYGIDLDFWVSSDSKTADDYVLSVGSDPLRDYDTLLKAADGLPLHVVTSSLEPRNEAMLKVASSYSHTELRSLYQNARLVVIPLKDLSQPSGQSVALQAMACGTPIIVTRTRGFWDPEAILDEVHCKFVKPYDVEDMKAAILELWEDGALRRSMAENARTLVEQKYSSHCFGRNLVSLLKNLDSTHS